MNLAEINNCLSPHAVCEKETVFKISEILDACEQSKSLMVGIYLIEKARFLYCSRNLKNILGNNRLQLLEDGWDYWFSRIDSKEIQVVKDALRNFFRTPFTNHSLTLRYHTLNAEGKRIFIKHELLLHKLKDQTLALNYLFDISDKERIEKLFDTPNEQYNNLEKDPRVSAREKEVLHLIANGFSSKEIADMLFISNHTAISHRKNLIEKFHVRNTAHLIKKASEIVNL